MPSPLTAAAAAPPDRSSLGWLILIPLGSLILIQALLTLTGIVPMNVRDGLEQTLAVELAGRVLS